MRFRLYGNIKPDGFYLIGDRCARPIAPTKMANATRKPDFQRPVATVRRKAKKLFYKIHAGDALVFYRIQDRATEHNYRNQTNQYGALAHDVIRRRVSPTYIETHSRLNFGLAQGPMRAWALASINSLKTKCPQRHPVAGQ